MPSWSGSALKKRGIPFVVAGNSNCRQSEGDIRGVRSEVKEHPIQILIRCDRPAVIAAQVFGQDHVTEVKLHEDKAGLFVRTRDADQFYRLLNQVILENELHIETVAPADEDVQSVYDYLIGEGRGNRS